MPVPRRRVFSLTGVSWSVVAVIALVDAVLLHASDFSLAWANETKVFLLSALMLAVWQVYERLRPVPRLAHLARSAALLLLASHVLALLSYLLTGLFPGALRDSTFAGVDRAFGLDWQAFHDWVWHSSARLAAARLFYASTFAQLFVLTFLLNLTARYRRADELLSAFTLAGVVVIVVGALLPAAGAFAWYSPPEAPASAYLHDYLALRNGTLRNLDHFEGIVQFPSFHAALSAVYIHVTRGIPGVFPVVLLLNLLVIAVTAPMGGHHFVDVLAGLGIVVVMIGLLRLVENRRPAR